MTRDQAVDGERLTRSFRRRVERAYREGRARVRRIERLGTIDKASRKFYINELKGVLATCLRNGVRRDDVRDFKRFVWSWFKKGAPIDPQVLGLPYPSCQIILRQVACAFPTLGHVNADARLWLSDPIIRANGQPIRSNIKNPRAFTEFFIPYNLTLYAPADTPYSAYNRQGVTLEYVDEASL